MAALTTTLPVTSLINSNTSSSLKRSATKDLGKQSDDDFASSMGTEERCTRVEKKKKEKENKKGPVAATAGGGGGLSEPQQHKLKCDGAIAFEGSFFSTDDELAAAITDVCKKARIELPCARSLAGSVFDATKLRHHSAKYRDRFHWHKTHGGHWTIFGIKESGRIVVTAIGHHQNKTIGGRGNNGYHVDYETGCLKPKDFKLPMYYGS